MIQRLVIYVYSSYGYRRIEGGPPQMLGLQKIIKNIIYIIIIELSIVVFFFS